MNKSVYKNTALTLLLLLSSATSALAGVITLDFPSAASTNTAALGEFYFSTTHSVKETFASAGHNFAERLDLSLMVDNRLANSAFVDFDVFLNSVLVGNFTITQAIGSGLHAFTFNLAEWLGGNFELMLAVTNDVAIGEGSINFIEGSSTATIAASVIPVPGSLALLGLGLLAVGMRRKSASTKT